MSLNEVLEAVRDLFRKKGYEPVFEKEHLEKLVKGHNVYNIGLTFLNGTTQHNLKSGVEFHPQFLKAINGKQLRLNIFFANVVPEVITQKIDEAFTSLSDYDREVLTGRFELDKPLKDVKITRSGKSSYTLKKINEALSNVSKNLLTLFLAGNLELKPEVLKDKTAIMTMSIEDCGFSVRTKNCLKAAEVKTVEQLVKCDRDALLRFRNFGQQGLCEIEDFKALMKLS
jgi:Bacterial RNA polymerase, alpha chain C terminal domain